MRHSFPKSPASTPRFTGHSLGLQRHLRCLAAIWVTVCGATAALRLSRLVVRIHHLGFADAEWRLRV
jgi:hypothetical protein